jgi:hypothetical protein
MMGSVQVWRVAATKATGPKDDRQPRGTLHAIQCAGHHPECGRSIHGMYLFLFEHDFTSIDGDRCPVCVERTVEPPPLSWAPSGAG